MNRSRQFCQKWLQFFLHFYKCIDSSYISQVFIQYSFPAASAVFSHIMRFNHFSSQVYICTGSSNFPIMFHFCFSCGNRFLVVNFLNQFFLSDQGLHLESELFTSDKSKHNDTPGPVNGEASAVRLILLVCGLINKFSLFLFYPILSHNLGRSSGHHR